MTAAIVPMRGGAVGSNQANGVELVNGLTPVVQGGVPLRGEAAGPALGHVGSALGFTTIAATRNKVIPVAVPFSVFAFVVRRDASASLQALIGNGALGNLGWTFQLNYASGQLGLTRWGIADNPTVALGAVPNTGGQASAVGLTLDGTTARFFLNGRFENVASGSVSAPSSTLSGYVLGATADGFGALVNTSIHVVYCWNRVLSDGEMLRLYQDPWAPLRPHRHAVGVTVAATDLLVTQSVAEIMRQPDPAARLTQVIAEAMRSPDPALRATQAVLEVMIPQLGITRVTQLALEVMVSSATGTGRARLSQALAEIMRRPVPPIRATQVVLEAMVSPSTALRLSQVVLEVMRAPSGPLRISQTVAEVMVKPGVLALTHKGQLFPRGSSLIKPA